MPLVQVDGLCVRYGGASRGSRPRPLAVDDVTFAIAPGEILGLVGPSGAGKSSVGRAVLRLVEPLSGRVTFTPPGRDPVDVTALPSRELRRFRRHAQMLFQDPVGTLHPAHTVREIVSEPRRVHRADVATDETWLRARLDEVGLEPATADRRPTELSGGQCQRVGLARALAVEPAFLVADEPVTALDVSIQAQVLDLMRDLQARRGLGMLFISHDLAVVAHLADRVAVLAAGRLVELGPTTQVVSSPQHPVTRAMVRRARVEAAGA